MRTITAKKITIENFAPYGEFFNCQQPEGYALSGEIHSFYPDRVTIQSLQPVSFSAIAVKRPTEGMVIKEVEYHSCTWEVIIPLDDDMVLHVSHDSKSSAITEVFLVPAGTAIKIKSGVCHYAPLPASKDLLHAVICLPERTYANDCMVVGLPEEEYFRIVL